MYCIQNSCIDTPTPFIKKIDSFTCLVITAIALRIIGHVAVSSDPFNAIVQFCTTNNEIHQEISIFIPILFLVRIGVLIGDLCRDGERLDPIVHLPKEAFFKIFSYLNEKELGRCTLVSKAWERVASDEALWNALCLRMAFGKEKWATYFGDIGEEPTLPPNICQILRSRPDFLNGKSVEETHLLVLIPSSVNGKPLTLNSMGDLVKGYNTGYRYIASDIVTEYGDKSIKASYWVLMSKDVLTESRNKNYSAQQELVKKYAEISQLEYRIPHVLEAAVCIFTEFVSSGKCLYSNNPWTYTRCQDKSKCYQIQVGGFVNGLFVDSSIFNHEDYGVGVLWEV